MLIKYIELARLAGWLLVLGHFTISSVQAGELHPGVVSAVPAAYTPHLQADDIIHRPLALAVTERLTPDAHIMYVGGHFLTVSNALRSATFARNHLFAFHATTGEIVESFAPVVNNKVFALLAVDDSLYVGGEFGTINGVARRGIAKLDANTGSVDLAFNARLGSGRVTEIKMVNGQLIIAGTFPNRLQAIDLITGTNTGYINIVIDGTLPLTTSRTEVYRFAVNPAGTRLVAVGNFTSVNAVNRRRAFMLNLEATAVTLSDWYYAPLDKKCLANKATLQPYLDDVDFAPDGSYFVFAATGFIPETTAEIGVAICDAAARFETDILNPVLPTWINYTGGDTIHSVIATGAAVYVQGHFRWLDNPFGRDFAGPGAVERKGIGAIDPDTGMALSWNPSAPAAQGGQDLLATSAGLWAASDSKRFGGKYHRGIAFVPLETE